MLLDDKIAIEKKVKDFSIHNTQSEDKKKSEPHIVTTHPSGNLVISIGTKTETIRTKVENTSSACKKTFSEVSETVKQPYKYQKTNSLMNVTMSENDQSSKRPKKSEEPKFIPRSKSPIIQLSECE